MACDTAGTQPAQAEKVTAHVYHGGAHGDAPALGSDTELRQVARKLQKTLGAEP